MTRLSSVFTWYFQYVLLAGWTFVGGVLAFVVYADYFFGMFRGNGKPPEELLLWMAPIMLLIGVLVFGFFFLKLRRAYYDDDFLCLHSAFGERMVPHESVSDLRVVPLISPKFFSLEYMEDDRPVRVWVMPRVVLFQRFDCNPHVVRYRRLVEQKRI